MIGCVTGGVERLERSEANSVGQLDVGAATTGGKRRGKALSQCCHRLGMIDVVVGERDPSQAATFFKRSRQALEMSRQLGAWIDDPGRIASHHPAVGARHRERARILGTQAQDAKTLQSLVL